MAEAERKAEVTERDFDEQQELLDRYRYENSKLWELVSRACGYIRFLQGTRKRDFEEEDDYITMVHELRVRHLTQLKGGQK